MTKPRPANMFQYPQESALAPKRDKLLFLEAMVASGELTGREYRVAFLITSLWSTTNGAAYPPMQWIADALGLDKRDVGKVLASLESKGWFTVRHGSRGRGKNHVNRYHPNVEKVASMAPFRDAVDRAERARAEREKVAIHPIKGGKNSLKGGTGATLSGDSLFGVLRTDTASLRSAPLAPRGADGGVASQASPAARLGIIEAHLRDGHPETLPPDARARWARETYAELTEIDEAFDGYTGDPIGGWAQRLSNEVYHYLDGDDAFEVDAAPDPDPEPAFQGENQETEHAEDVGPGSSPPPGMREVELEEPPAKRAWHKPTYVEVDFSRFPGGRKFGPWLAGARNRLRVQVRELADAIGISATDLFDLEIGYTEVASATQRKYIAALQVLVAGDPPAREPDAEKGAAQQKGAANLGANGRLAPIQAEYGGSPTVLVQIVDFLRGEGGTVERFDVIRALGLSPEHAQASLKTLRDRAWIERVGHGRYRLTEAARAEP
jgi:DNA-binding MarR family transcriptional regulator